MTTRTVAQRTAERLAEIRERGQLERTAEVSAVNVAERTVELAFSSTAEVERWGWMEVLSHDAGAVRLARLNDGGALLDNHNWNAQRGVVEKAWIDADGKGRAIVRFGKSAAADELFVDVCDKIKRHVSVGYIIHAIKLTEEREGGFDVWTATDWEPYEISIVSVPADTSVGVGRAAPISQVEPPSGGSETARVLPETSGSESDSTREHAPMTVKVVRNAAGDLVRAKVNEAGEIVETIETLERASAPAPAATPSASGGDNRGESSVAAERSRITAIDGLARKFGSVEGVAEMTSEAIGNGTSVEDFQRNLLGKLDARAATPLAEQAAGADIGLSARELAGYSIVKVVRALADPTDKRAQREAAFEFEASEAARAKQDKPSDRFVIPTDVLRHGVLGSQRAMNTSTAGGSAGNTGGYAIATDLLAGSYIETLRKKATIMRKGRVIGGLVGNIDIPKQTGGATGYIIGEDADATETGIELGQVPMTPKTVAAYSEVTRRLLMQSSLDIEALLRLDLAAAMGLTIDRQGYYGSGTGNNARGIANYAGINAVPFVAAQPTFAELVQMETEIATDNADVDSMGYVSNAGFRGYAKTHLKFDGVAGTIWEPGSQVNGYDCEITNQIDTGDVFMGNFADLLIGLWGGLEMTVDPYSNSKKGRVRIVTFQDFDFALRRVESFCLGRPA